MSLLMEERLTKKKKRFINLLRVLDRVKNDVRFKNTSNMVFILQEQENCNAVLSVIAYCETNNVSMDQIRNHCRIKLGHFCKVMAGKACFTPGEQIRINDAVLGGKIINKNLEKLKEEYAL